MSPFSALKMDKVCFYDMLVSTYKFTSRHNPEKRRFPLENLILAQLVSISPPPPIVHKGTLTCLQELVNGFYPEPDESNPHVHTSLL
jgi:hypothetical protein